jgi:hypothetical protein
MATKSLLPALTFGIEMEFIFIFRLIDFRNWVETKTDCREVLTARDYLESILNYHILHPNLLQPSSLNGVKVQDERLPITNWIIKGDISIEVSTTKISQEMNTTKQVICEEFDRTDSRPQIL